MENLNREIFICDCNSLEHQYALWYDEGVNHVYMQPHLVSKPWYKRIVTAIKHIFGHKSNYGDFDDTIIKINDMPRIKEYLDKAIEEDKKRELEHENQKEKSDI